MSVISSGLLQLDCRFDPPSIPVSTDFVSVTSAFTITMNNCADLTAQPCHLELIHVGRPPEKFNTSLGAAGIDVDALSEKGIPTDTRTERVFATICDAVEFCESLQREQAQSMSHFVLFIHEVAGEDTQRLGSLIDGSDRALTRYDLFGACAGLDLRLLNQAGLLMGGLFSAPIEGELDSALLKSRLMDLANQKVNDLTVSLQWLPNVLPVHVFSFSDQPRFLRDLGAEATPYAHRFFFGPISDSSKPTTFVFRALVKRKTAGLYKVATVSISGQDSGTTWRKSFDLLQPATEDLALSSYSDPMVGLALDRLRPSLWWEEICQAFTREDGNHIVRTFERLIAHEYEHNRLESVAALRTMRMQFIRGGFFGLEALGKLWSLTHRSMADLAMS